MQKSERLRDDHVEHFVRTSFVLEKKFVVNVVDHVNLEKKFVVNVVDHVEHYVRTTFVLEKNLAGNVADRAELRDELGEELDENTM